MAMMKTRDEVLKRIASVTYNWQHNRKTMNEKLAELFFRLQRPAVSRSELSQAASDLAHDMRQGESD